MPLRLVAATLLLLLAGCATVSEPRDERDPLEGFNRTMYRFNDAFDRAIAKPVAEGYQKVVPRPVNRGISNFFSNLGDVVVLLNDVFQLKGQQAASDLGRIAFNSTVGLGGIFDVASHMDMPKHNEDFGQTLGYWGVGPGPYLVLPFLGPSTIRDGIGRLPDAEVYPVYRVDHDRTRWSLIAIEAVDTRAGLLRAGRVLEEAALDPYTFLRDAYLQKRRYEIHDGNPPLDEFDPLLDDPEFDPLAPEEEPVMDPNGE